MTQAKLPRRTVFDLSFEELQRLKRLDSHVDSTKQNARRPSRLRARTYPGCSQDYSIDAYHYDLAVYARQNAVAERKAWLQQNRISTVVARQAQQTYYRPYENAELIDKVAPPMPEAYATALANEAKP